jgi:hypothetical protein
VLVEDGPLEAFYEGVGPGMAGLRAVVADAEVLAGLIESTLEFTVPMGDDALDGPADLAVVGDENTAQEAFRDVCGGLSPDEDASHRIGGGRVAGVGLPDLVVFAREQ